MRFATAIRLAVVAALWCAALAPAPARADDDDDVVSYEVSGSIESSEKDARTKALDRSFAVAVEKALARLADAKVRKAYENKLRDEVVLRARLFVASYKITDTFESEGMLSLTVTVHIDLAKLRQRLDELGIDSVVVQPPAGIGERPKIVVLMHSDLGGAIEVTFGADRTETPASKAVAAAVSAAGFEVVDARKAKVPVTREAEQGVPLGDDAARAMANELGAGGVVVIGLQARDAGGIRGTRLLGATCAVHARVLDVATGDVLADGDHEGASFGDTLEAALEAAASDAVAAVASAASAAIARQWPRVDAPDNAVVVRVRDYVVWRNVEAIIAQLEKTRGVDKVWTRAFSQSEVELAVVTELSAKKVAAAVAKTKTDDITVDAKRRDDRRVVATVRDR